MALAFMQKHESSLSWPTDFTVCVVSGEEKTIPVRSSAPANAVVTKPLVPTLKHFVALKISAVPQVENVFTMVDNAAKTIYVYTVVDDFDAAVRSNIYDKEQAIIEEFAMFDFDFHIISRMGAPLSDCVNEPNIDLTFQR